MQFFNYKRVILSWIRNSRKRTIDYVAKSSTSDISQNACKVLYINSSGSNRYSITGKTAQHFLAMYNELKPEHIVEEIQLWDKTLLNFSLSHVESKTRIDAGKENTDDREKLDAIKLMISQLKSASKVIISSPMWNYSVPYVLKQYIDCVVQPDLTFTDTVGGPVGLVTGRPLLLITSSSYDFSEEPMKSLDFQVPYLKAIFGMIGFQEFHHIYLANTENVKHEELMGYAKLRIMEVIQTF